MLMPGSICIPALFFDVAFDPTAEWRIKLSEIAYLQSPVEGPQLELDASCSN
jgi:hypothetical protein